MPRRARLSLPGVPLHVVQRGHNRSTCFFTESDFRYYLHLLERHGREAGCAIHAYVLMTNHVHLLVTPRKKEDVAQLMQRVGQQYVQHVNRMYARNGTLWDGRFKSSLTRDEAYILTCYRYIELNPVRAGMVVHPGQYPWSSYLANAEGVADPVVTPHEQYLAMGLTEDVRLHEYRRLLTSCLDDATVRDIRCSVNGNRELRLRSNCRKQGTDPESGSVPIRSVSRRT